MDSYFENKEELESKFNECKNIFIALGDETRQKILLILLKNKKEGMRVNDIANQTPLSRPAVSHHLKILKDNNIIGLNRIGTKNYYYINVDKLAWEKLANLSIDVCNKIEEKRKNED